QIARLHGTRVFATVGSDDKAARVRELGAEAAINYRTTDFLEEVRRLTGKRGVDVMIDSVGQESWDKSLKALARGGRLVTCRATGTAVLTLNRPGARNAINLEMVEEIRAALGLLAKDSGTRVLILTGAGSGAFASGADIRELRGRRAADALRGINSSLFLEIERFALPTIAAVRGYALGGGCELALACDLRIAGE